MLSKHVRVRAKALVQIFSVALAGLLATLLLLAACGGTEEATTTAEDSYGIKKGGTLRVGMLADHVTFDPPLVLGMPDILQVIHTHDPLIFRNADLTLRGALAENYYPNEDSTTWTFELRKGVYFYHYENDELVKGKEFQAEDVIFTINRMHEVESPLSGTLRLPDRLVEVDPYTVRFEYDAPNAVLIEGLVKYQAGMTPSNGDTATFAKGAPGTGAFILTSHIPGERTTFVKNPDYWAEDMPLVDEMVFVFLTSPEARAEALKAGTIDIIFDLDTTSIPGLNADPETAVQTAPSGGYMNVALRVDTPPFDNKKLRQALQMATDRNAVLQAAQFGLGSIAYDHPITPNHPVFNPDCVPPDYNPEGAKELLAQAGYPDGISLTIHTSSAGAAMVEMATVLKESFRPAGIDLTINVMPEDGYWAEGWMVKPMTTVWWGGRPPYEGFSIVYTGGASWNESYYANDEVDALLIEAMSAGTLERQKEIFGRLQCIVVDEVPRIIVVFRPVALGIRNDVRGSAPMWDATASFHTVWLDR